jgi:hypothetical protein
MLKRETRIGLAMVVAAAVSTAASAAITITYNVDAGGNKDDHALNGLAAEATYQLLSPTQLQIALRNVSTGVPTDFDFSDSLLVSLGLDLPVSFSQGLSAVIGAGSAGRGGWAALGAGADVSSQWVFTNGGAGDALADYTQVITTSNGLGGATAQAFAPRVTAPVVGGPTGGIAANPELRSNPAQPYVRDTIVFTLNLAGSLTEGDLLTAAANGVVEFGSDARYLTSTTSYPPNVVPVPEPGAVLLGLLGLASAGVIGRRR